MRTIISFTAALWLFTVGLQGVSHLARYGLVPGLPVRLGLIDFTPQYTLLAGLVVVVAIARRLVPDAVPVENRDNKRK
ncbi:MAG TPA: hypothetical protein VGM51_05165 [Armatimonadota bacterium]|jgi:hypothetical protein